MKFRPPAVPLITADPFFSIWSFADKLYDDTTRYWSGRQNAMNAGVFIDGIYYSLMGRGYVERGQYKNAMNTMPQISLEVKPLSTQYQFKNESAEVTLLFITPLLIDRLDILARPVSYIEYDITVTDGKEHEISFYFDISAECVVDTWKQEVVFGRTAYGMFCQNKDQTILGSGGDICCIDWGALHLIHENTRVIDGLDKYIKKPFARELDIDKAYNAVNEQPCMACESKKRNDVIILAYDEVKSMEYFNEQLDEFYKNKFASFGEMIEASIAEYPVIKKLCFQFNERLSREAGGISEEYERILSLIYRQVIGAHKIAQDKDGNILFISKECGSGGFAATLDVTYPSIPMFLKYNTELVKGMLRPIFKLAASEAWGTREFAPHDVGYFPVLNGQEYRKETDEQMPVEECGNAIITVAAICNKEKNNTFAAENKEMLKLWADYLVENGYDPGEQLCTDDFAGKWSHNCNLSVKSIIAIGAYGKIFNDSYYTEKAKEFAKKWVDETKSSNGTMLAFACGETWSIKYNLVWDKILGLDLFPEHVYAHEIECYKSKISKYGLPLDCREDYTKADWLAWTTVMTDDKDYTKLIYEKIFDFLNETPDRVPVSDWYYATSGRQAGGFQNRTVLGALFINIM